MITPTYLLNKNRHERDKRIQFFEEGHKYLVNNETDYTSTTTFIHSLFEVFDAEKIINGILKKRDWSNNPEYKYYRMSAEDIKAMWNDNANQASSAGTKMHYNIECYFNNMQYEIDKRELYGDGDGDGLGGLGVVGVVEELEEKRKRFNEVVEMSIFPPVVDDGSVEASHFKNFVEEIVLKEELEPYRTEMLVFDTDVKISGSIDMLYRKKNGEYAIFDWKRAKEITFEGFFGKKSVIECIKHLDDSNFWHYSLQLNIYRRILEKNYGMKVNDLRLVVLHPDNWNYQCLTVPFLDNEIDALFDMRKNEINKMNV